MNKIIFIWSLILSLAVELYLSPLFAQALYYDSRHDSPYYEYREEYEGPPIYYDSLPQNPYNDPYVGVAQCYWMENYSGRFEWVPANPVYQKTLNKLECYSLDSCDGGGGQSGGGCYKWAISPQAERIPW